MIDQQIEERKRLAMVAAEALLADYQEDTELTSFTVFDGEDSCV